MRVTDLHPNGDALPGRDLGIHAVRGGSAVVFDATDGVNGRQLWVSDGTTNGTQVLGAVEAVSPVVWADGLLFRSTANELVWTNGSDLRAWTNLPSWDDDLQENVAMNLSGLDNVGQAWLHADKASGVVQRIGRHRGRRAVPTRCQRRVDGVDHQRIWKRSPG